MTTEASAADHATRIVVAVTAPRLSRRTLEVAVALARRLHAELEAVLVEESDLLDVADLPLTHEIDLASGTTRTIDSARMARLLRAEAENLRRELASLAPAGRRDAPLRVVRGRYVDEAAGAAERGDIAFLHRASRRAAASMRRPVWVLFDDTAGAQRALGVAASIVAELGCVLVALIPAPTSQEGAALATRARALAGAAADAMLVRVVASEAPARLAEGAGARGASLLVLARAAVQDEAAGRPDWLAELTIPLVLVA